MKVRTAHACVECGQHLAQWAGRCPGCGAWGTIEEQKPAGPGGAGFRSPASSALSFREDEVARVTTGFDGVDRVLGGGIVPASVVLLAGEPGIGKSTLLLQLVANLTAAGRGCLIASGEESRSQLAARAKRLGLAGESLSFMPGRDLQQVIGHASATRPFMLAVDSVQTLRDPDSATAPGGPSQVRLCADALVGIAKEQGIAVLMTGHVTKDGDLAGPRTLEHAVDVVLSFEGEARSGHRILAGGKNRFGTEGEVAWFEMSEGGLGECDPPEALGSGVGEAGSAIALPMAGRRALAVEVQALAAPTEGSPRRQATGLDSKRFQLVAAVVDRLAGVPLSRSDLFGAASGGIRLDDPACDLAVAAALASAATGVPPPASTAFVGEITLTGRVRTAPAMRKRLAAAAAQGVKRIVSAETGAGGAKVEMVGATDVATALAWSGK